MVAASVARPGRAVAIMAAAALTADAMLPCSTIGDTDMTAVTSVRVRTGPLSRFCRSSLASWPGAGLVPVPGQDGGRERQGQRAAKHWLPSHLSRIHPRHPAEEDRRPEGGGDQPGRHPEVGH